MCCLVVVYKLIWLDSGLKCWGLLKGFVRDGKVLCGGRFMCIVINGFG